MGCPSMTPSQIDYSDVQGLVRFGYKRMTEASYVLLRIRDVGAARSWLGVAPVTTAVAVDPPPATAMQVAFTAAGLKALGVADAVLSDFSSEFLAGMTEDSRSRRLGDEGNSAPSQWAWGNSGSVPHLVVMFFAEPGRLETFVATSTGKAWNDAFDVLRSLDTGDLGGFEPFGFTDGISQPQLDWEQQRDVAGGQIYYTNVAALGEFLLGYRNEYDKYTDRPLIDANARSAGLLPAEDAPEKKDVGRNGTYLVMRDLRQDVRSFWQFISRGKPVGILRKSTNLPRRSSAGREQAIRWCQSRKKKFPGLGPNRIKFVRINSHSIKIRRALAVLSVHISAERILAMPTIPATRPALHAFWQWRASAQEDSATISCPPFAFIAFCDAAGNMDPAFRRRTPYYQRRRLIRNGDFGLSVSTQISPGNSSSYRTRGL